MYMRILFGAIQNRCLDENEYCSLSKVFETMLSQTLKREDRRHKLLSARDMSAKMAANGI